MDGLGIQLGQVWVQFKMDLDPDMHNRMNPSGRPRLTLFIR